MAGSNFTSPGEQGGGYGDFSHENSYQRSHSVSGNISSGMGNQSNANNEWGWKDSPQKQMPTSKSYHNQFTNSNNGGAGNRNALNDDDDDWSGFDSYQDSTTSYQNTTPLTSTTNKNLKLAETTKKLSEGFDGLDVKSTKEKVPVANKTAEDDAWNLLMN